MSNYPKILISLEHREMTLKNCRYSKLMEMKLMGDFDISASYTTIIEKKIPEEIKMFEQKD